MASELPDRRDMAYPVGATVAKPWEQRMREHVAELLRQGYSFNFAWQQALNVNRPSIRDRRRVEPWGEMTLFSEPVSEEPSVVEATRAYFEDAFLGYRPGLKHFTLDLVGEADGPRPASPHGRLDAAA